MRIHTRTGSTGYAPLGAIADSYGFSPAEIRDMAERDPVLIRSVRVNGETLYRRADASWVRAVTTPVERVFTDVFDLGDAQGVPTQQPSSW